MDYTGELMPDWIFQEVRQVVETDYFQDRADIYIDTQEPDDEGGLEPVTSTKIAENVPFTKRMATSAGEARVGETLSEIVTYHMEFPLIITWLTDAVDLITPPIWGAGEPTLITPRMRIVSEGVRYEVSEQTNPKTYSPLQMVLAVKR